MTAFAVPQVRVGYDADGSLVLRHGQDLLPYDRQVGTWLRRWADQAPDRVALGAWDSNGQLHTITYAALRTAVDRIAQGLLDRGLGQNHPVALLGDKTLPHALLTLAALQVGIPISPISPAYSLRPEARVRLRFCLDTVRPSLVVVPDRASYAAALALLPPDTTVIADAEVTSLGVAPREVDAAFDAVDPDAPAKILFTSGSTGNPKPVINTQRMMCSNAQAQAQLFPFLEARPPVVVDWQPWHHCGGSSHNFHAVLRNGGSYFIDGGKPTTPDAFAPTLHALRSISPTLHFNVPLGYERLAFHLARDEALARHFFAQLDCIVYSAASMPTALWDSLQQLSARYRGHVVPMVSSYGMTEMAPLHTSLHWHEGAPGMIGLPIPGSSVKLAATGPLLELRARGPNVTPGYHDNPALTAAAFDDAGWYCSGDAVELADPADPARGLRFVGRVGDRFKLLSGTWVPTDQVRTAVLAATAPLLDDVLVAGEGRDAIGLLLIANTAARRELASDLQGIEWQDRIRNSLAAYNAANPASSRRIAAALVIDDIPSLARGETTDKGFINQVLAIRNRPGLVARLFDPTDPDVLRWPA